MSTKPSPFEILKILKTELPQCFKYGNDKVPLSDSICDDIVRYYANDTRFDSASLQKAIEFYTSSNHYLKKVKVNSPKIDLNGKCIGHVSASEADRAGVVLSQREQHLKIKRSYLDKQNYNGTALLLSQSMFNPRGAQNTQHKSSPSFIRPFRHG